MAGEAQNAADMLFGDPDRRTLNVKVARGRSAHVTADQIGNEIIRAEMQMRDGTAVRVIDIDGDLSPGERERELDRRLAGMIGVIRAVPVEGATREEVAGEIVKALDRIAAGDYEIVGDEEDGPIAPA